MLLGFRNVCTPLRFPGFRGPWRGWCRLRKRGVWAVKKWTGWGYGTAGMRIVHTVTTWWDRDGIEWIEMNRMLNFSGHCLWFSSGAKVCAKELFDIVLCQPGQVHASAKKNASLHTSLLTTMSRHVGLSENSVPLHPLVNDHYPYEKWLFHWEYTLFSDIPTCLNHWIAWPWPSHPSPPSIAGFFVFLVAGAAFGVAPKSEHSWECCSAQISQTLRDLDLTYPADL